jgi:hypothetical protein
MGEKVIDDTTIALLHPKPWAQPLAPGWFGHRSERVDQALDGKVKNP